jgi:Beta protein
VDLILDVGQVQRDDVNMLSKSIIGVLATLPHVKEWRTLTLTSGAFPESVGYITVMDTVPRADWLLWQSITSKGKALARLPIYGDYSIQCTQPATPEESMHMGSANIRYTADDHWLVLRGRGLRQHGYEQYHELARVLTRQNCYTGRTFSWGDNYIFDCAGEAETTGNQTTWRKVGTSHHMAMVLKQLTSPRVP